MFRGIAVVITLLATPAARAEKPLLVPGAELAKVTGGLEFSEGPAWHGDGYLLFEDIPRGRILKLGAHDEVSVYREPSGKANGLAFDAQGRLVAAEGEGRRISRTEKDGKVVTLADRYGGKRLNSPNDLAIDARGRIYFTDPRYGDRKGVEQDKEAVYRIDPDSKLVRLIDSVTRPNGIAVSADQKTLFVADNASPDGPSALLAFDLRPDGSVANRRALHDFGRGRGIDGMALDAEGRLWATAGSGDQAGVHVFALDAGRSKATLLTNVRTPEDPTNCAFGGPKRDWLYVTTAHALYRIRTTTHGAPGPPGK